MNQRLGNKEQTDSDQRGEEGSRIMGERKGRGKQRNRNRGLTGMDCGSGGHGVGEINGVKGRTTVNEQQEQKI